jgi:hypothetical protein
MTRSKVWTCQRQSGGLKCGYQNPKVKKKCLKCGKARPPKKAIAHKAILEEMPIEKWIEIFGNECGICKKSGDETQLYRDHDHHSHAARGVLCFRCNTPLRDYMTLEWMTKAVIYLQNAELFGIMPTLQKKEEKEEKPYLQLTQNGKVTHHRITR